MIAISNTVRSGGASAVTSSARPTVPFPFQSTETDSVRFGMGYIPGSGRRKHGYSGSGREGLQSAIVLTLGVFAVFFGGMARAVFLCNSGTPPTPPPPQVVVTQKNVNMDVTSKEGVKTLAGQINGSSVNVELSPKGEHPRTIKGTVNGQSIDQSIDQQTNTNGKSYTISGSFQEKPVNLAITWPNDSTDSIKGIFQGEKVDVAIINNWGTRYINGSLGDKAVNLKVEDTGWSARKISGVIGSEEVETTVADDWGNIQHITGGIQADKPGSVEDNFLLNLMLFNQIRYSSGKHSHPIIAL